jgi:hypothetical protein
MNAPLANSIVLSITKKLRQVSSDDSANHNIFQELPPEPVVPSNICSPLLSLFDVPPIELARQLTIIEFARFKAIKVRTKSSLYVIIGVSYANLTACPVARCPSSLGSCGLAQDR